MIDDSEITNIADGWVKYSLTEKRGDDTFFWAWERLHDLVYKEPEEAWRIIERLPQIDTSDFMLASVAAGPVEDLLCYHGERFVDRIETLGLRDRLWRRLLGAVWKSTTPETVWKRIKVVAGPSF